MRVEASKQKSTLKFIKLGILVNISPLTVSPLVKYQTVTRIDKKSGKMYHVGIVVRENGRMEVYSDYILVNEYYNPKFQCIDVRTDFNKFSLKFVKDADKVDRTMQASDLKIEIRYVPHFWRNRISLDTSKSMSVEKWHWTLHKRIASYFNLYT